MEKQKEKNKENTMIFTVVLCVLVFFLGIYLGKKGVMETENCPKCELCMEKPCLNEHSDYDYLKENACILYENYKNQYLTIDKIANQYPEYRNTAIVKENYETFKGWDSFKDKYCE